MKHQMDEFNARIARINDPRNAYYRDPETGINVPKRLSKSKILSAAQSHKPGLISMGVSLVIGVICLMGARYVRFNYGAITETGTEAQTLMLMDFGLAAMMAFVVGGLLRHKTVRHMGSQMAGIAVMSVAMHNLVWMYPAEFAQVFSPSYVEQVKQVTAPQSLYLRGAIITL